MANVLAFFCIALVILFAFFLIIKNKKQGKACIGCPYSGQCKNRNKCEERKAL